MAFQSGQFFILLVAALVLYYRAPAKWQNTVLLLASAVFYAVTGLQYVCLLVVAVLLCYAAAIGMEVLRKNGKQAWLTLVFCAVLVLLFANLGAFKYYDALAKLLPLPRLSLGLLAPLGVSFYTFTLAGYVIDVRFGSVHAEKNPWKLMLFAGFFPLIASGPIERSSTLLPQFAAYRRYDYQNIAAGTVRMLWGFVKKFVIANTLSLAIGTVFLDVRKFTGPYLLLAGLLYPMQLYYDFGGYSDIAIGAAQLFGITVRENFKRPFAVSSFADYWQRWHISLTSWFRDYVFVPLSFSARGSAFPVLVGALCQCSIFVLSGIWHGASANYLAWGILNGVLMAIGHVSLKKRRALAKKNPLYQNKIIQKYIQRSITYLLVAACLAVMRTETLADTAVFFSHLFTGWGEVLQLGSVVATLKSLQIGRNFIALTFGGMLLVEWAEWRSALAHQTIGTWLTAQKVYWKMPLFYLLSLLVLFCGILGGSPFIYFQF